MGITLNVWVFSGIIGVAYIMGYLMSRTMGRVLATEGADAEPGETAWADRPGLRETAARRGQTGSGETAWADRPGLRETAARRGQTGSGETVWADRPGLREASAQSCGTDQGEETWGDSAEQQEPHVQSRRAGRSGTSWIDAAALRQKQARYRGERAYTAGRQSQDVEDDRGETREWQKARVPRRYHSRSHREQQARPAGHPIASPVAGQVDILESQGRRGVRLTPEDNRVYAPASGKIIRLYPRGNEFLLRTDSGVVLRLQAGERDAEMTRDYFRPRVVQNEFVGKGKLLLEYDREALARDGYDTHVCMTVEENENSYDLSVTGSMWVKNGQDCLWVL